MTTKTAKIPVNSVLVTVYFLSLTLLCALGGWQMLRGMEKVRIESRIAESDGVVEHLDHRPQDWDSLAYRQVGLQGEWLDRMFLLDNRIHQGRAGYELFAPLMLGDQALVMVNLGWLSRTDLEADLPPFEQLDGSASITGQLYLPQKGFTLGPPSHDDLSWPRVIQYLDFEYFSDSLGKGVEPAVLVADNANLGTVGIWQPMAMDSSRHFGYAVQWWGLAAVLVVFGFIWYNRAGKNGQEEQNK